MDTIFPLLILCGAITVGLVVLSRRMRTRQMRRAAAAAEHVARSRARLAWLDGHREVDFETWYAQCTSGPPLIPVGARS